MGRNVTDSVLVLEGESSFVMDLEDTLHEAGFAEVTTVSSCADAVDWLQENTPRVVIVQPKLLDGWWELMYSTLAKRMVPVMYCGFDVSIAELKEKLARPNWLRSGSVKMARAPLL